MEQEQAEMQDWPLRPWILGGMLAFAGLLIFLLTDGAREVPWRVAGAAFVFFTGIAAAFTLRPESWRQALGFSLTAGLVMGGLAWHAVDVGNHVAGEEFGFAAGVFATLLAVPLFQAGFHETRLDTPYRLTHFHVWTDAVTGGGAIAFTALSWLLLVLLNALFELIDIDLIDRLMREDWFGWVFSGGAFGAALGVLRNQLKIIGTLQSVVLLVLSLLAVPLGIALVLFLVPLVLSGGEVLWSTTRNATPVLLSCAAGAFILTNATIRDDDSNASQNRIMRIAAMVLGAGVLPLTAFAAISMGVRIGQYGLAPERIWGMIAVSVALAYGAAYWWGLARGWKGGWADRLRRSNLYLAAGVCMVAFLVALPILDFGAISTRNQLGRLESGAVSAEDFDYYALRYDFGDAGREALAELAESEDGVVAKLAVEARDSKNQYSRYRPAPDSSLERRKANLRMDFADESLREAVYGYLVDRRWLCEEICTALDLGANEAGRHRIALVHRGEVAQLIQRADGTLAEYGARAGARSFRLPRDGAGSAEPSVELRPFAGRQIYIDGKPVGDPFE